MRSYLANGGFIGRTANYRNTESYLQYVGGLTSSNTGAVAGTRSISLAGISMLEGDMVIVAYERTGTTSKTATTISGYTTIAALYADNTQTTPLVGIDSNLIVAYKFMGTTPDTNLVIPTSGFITDAEAVVVQVWRGIDPSNPLDVAAVTNTQVTTGIPNPPAITPVKTGAIIVVAAGTGHNGGTDTFTAAYLTNFLTVGGNDDTDATVGMGWLTWPGGAYDPAAWTFSQTDNIAFASNSVTFALRPMTSNAKNSGIWSLPAEFNAKTIDVQGQQEYLAGGGPFNFVVPANVYRVSALAIGAGGGGGGWSSASDEASGGGGGGALSYATFAVTPGETLTINVGAAGAAGGGQNRGSAGTTSSVQRAGTNLVAAGGGGGGGSPDDNNSNGGAGGTVITGTGFPGGAGGTNSQGTNRPVAGGGGAGGYTGAGGAAGGVTVTNGTAGTGGAGGGGAALFHATAQPAATFGTGHGGGGGVGVFGPTTSGTGGIRSSLFLTVATIGTASFTNRTTTNVTGTGSGATFNVTQNAANNGYTVTLVSGGTGYSATAGSNTIRILGTNVGGATTANDITITITAISGSAISTFTIPAAGNTGNLSAGNAMATLTSTSGDATGGTGGPFTITNGSAGVVVTNGSGGTSPSGTWSITVTRSGSVYTTSVTTGGTAFGVGDTIFIPYTLIGGALQSGGGGSGGDAGTAAGGLYGGGGRGGIPTNQAGAAGARGAVRIVWGFDYTFPSGAPSGIVGIVEQLGINYLPQIDQY